MNDNQFNNQNNVRRMRKPRKSFADRLIGWGIVQNEQQANLVLLGLVVVLFAAIIIINMKTFGSSAPEDPLMDDPATILE